MKKYFVYILASISGTLYTGMTNDLMRRVLEHKEGKILGFTQKYKAKKLVYFEDTGSVHAAIQWEKHIKGWLRKKKIELVETVNPKWEDLSWEWIENTDSSLRSGRQIVCRSPLEKERTGEPPVAINPTPVNPPSPLQKGGV